MVPSAAYSPRTGFHSVNTSGGSPAAISDSSLASPVELGMLDSVTWMSGWVALNLVTISLSRVSVLPDHMVCQVMSTTPPLAVEPGLAAGAAVPPQAATASRPAAAASTVTDLALRLFLMLALTICSFFSCTDWLRLHQWSRGGAA